MSKLILRFSLLAAVSQLVVADGLFAQCSYGLNGYSSFTENLASVDECTAYCQGQGTAYSYTQYGGYYCYCSDSGPNPNYQSYGQKYSCGNQGLYEVSVVSTSFDSTTCYSYEDASTSDVESFSPTSDPKACLNTCASSRKAVVQRLQDIDTGSYQYYCGCGSEFTGTVRDCEANDFYVFDYPADATASGLSRRNARELANARRQIPYNACPGGFTACLVPGLEKLDAWECVDIKNDIESCGGCLNGANNNATTAVGESCSKLGVKLGAATCQAGKCVVEGCKAGFELINNECIRKE